LPIIKSIAGNKLLSITQSKVITKHKSDLLNEPHKSWLQKRNKIFINQLNTKDKNEKKNKKNRLLGNVIKFGLTKKKKKKKR
jgi:hypothetical protein